MAEFLNLLLISINLSIAFYFLFRRKGNKNTNVFFTVLILLISFKYVAEFVFNEMRFFDKLQIPGINIPLLYLIPPVYFFLIKSIFYYRIKFRLRDIAHIMLFLTVLFFLLPLFFASETNKQIWIEKYNNQFNAIINLFTGIFYAQFIIYVYIVLKFLRSILLKVKKLNWIPNKLIVQTKMLSYITIFYLFIQMIILYLHNYPQLMMLAPFFQLLIVIILFYIFSNSSQITQLQSFTTIIADSNKYDNNNLSESDKKDILKAIDNYLEKEKKIPEKLSFETLAKQLIIPEHHLAQAIYSKYENGFDELIENY